MEVVCVREPAPNAAGDLRGRPGDVAFLRCPHFRLSTSCAGAPSAGQCERAHFLRVEFTSHVADFTVAGRRPPSCTQRVLSASCPVSESALRLPVALPSVLQEQVRLPKGHLFRCVHLRMSQKAELRRAESDCSCLFFLNQT